MIPMYNYTYDSITQLLTVIRFWLDWIDFIRKNIGCDICDTERRLS